MENSVNFIIILLVCGLTITSCKDSKLKMDLLKFQNQEALETKNIETVKFFYKYLDSQDTALLSGLVAKDFVCV